MCGVEFSGDKFEKYSVTSHSDNDKYDDDGIGYIEISSSPTKTTETYANNNNDRTRGIQSINRNFSRDEYLNITR